MNNKKLFIKGIILGVAISAIIIPAVGLSAIPTVRSIKPAATQTAPLSDEQQGILAVRKAKASVVSIIGAVTIAQSTSTEPSLQAVPNDHIEGTGFIVEQNGLIVSNNHVVEDASLAYRVVFPDGTEFPAKVIGLDKYDDVAILKIEATGLPAVTFGDSSALETGQTVFAIGNSLGRYQNSVTKGVVSAQGRAISTGSTSANLTPRLQNLIQTDAAINPGNSGGPLIDMSGAVVGMNTLIDTEGSGLGFAIPINTVKDAVAQLKVYGKVSKAYMGVTFVTVDGQLKALKNLTIAAGAYINTVAPGSPAAMAGLQEGDIITEINHSKITVGNELDAVVTAYAPGTQILVTYMRGGKRNDAALVLGVLP